MEQSITDGWIKVSWHLCVQTASVRLNDSAPPNAPPYLCPRATGPAHLCMCVLNQFQINQSLLICYSSNWDSLSVGTACFPNCLWTPHNSSEQVQVRAAGVSSDVCQVQQVNVDAVRKIIGIFLWCKKGSVPNCCWVSRFSKQLKACDCIQSQNTSVDTQPRTAGENVQREHEVQQLFKGLLSSLKVCLEKHLRQNQRSHVVSERDTNVHWDHEKTKVRRITQASRKCINTQMHHTFNAVEMHLHRHRRLSRAVRHPPAIIENPKVFAVTVRKQV